jgi:acetyl-CoA synthetase
MIKSNSTIVDVDCKKKYEDIYSESIKNPESYWAEMAEENVSWYKKWDNVLYYDFRKPFVKWFSGAKFNITYNCLDRHIMTDNRNKAALICESETDSISYNIPINNYILK